ncbi:TRAP transporter small permease [Nafulsella turpanensis]|uniref:TRAP transporter small permease n=1 Tax=Nafulsella turpanensis TaxID=1265690 RepID=UPI00034BCE26|nr:TRAP transporter small permease [Nafulsella turpanensis]
MKLRRVIDKTLFWLLVVLMGLMVINVLWQVASRFILQSPSSFTDELSRYLLIWVGILGASYVTGQKMHLAIDIFPNSLKGKKQRRLNIFINIVVALFAFFAMVWGGFNLMYITLKLEQTSASLGIPLGYVYMVIPLSGLLIIYYSIVNLFEKNTEPEELGETLA